MNILGYRREISAVLPRVLASFDTDPLSASAGVGDRLYWSWKLIDYPNATAQGTIHGLAILAAKELLPWNLNPRSIIHRIDLAIRACKRLTSQDGSLAEAFPNEKSFCVTALVAFDILCAVDCLRSKVEPAQINMWLSIVEPLIRFLMQNDETHAIISNHLATAVAALFRWSEFGHPQAKARAQELLKLILDHQSPEGWFNEYGGFDPGYETLGLYYLADIHMRRPCKGLKDSLSRSLRFLSQAAHPDGSFGGHYGSRNTRFIVPAGLEMLAGEIPEAAALTAFTRRAIEKRTVPTLATMDDPNLAPMFNSYCRALDAAGALNTLALELPYESAGVWRRTFPGAGLVIDKGQHHYTIISTKKGGVVYHFRAHKPFLDVGVAATQNGERYTTQSFSSQNSVELRANQIVVTASFVRAVSERMTPTKLILLRILCLTIFRNRAILEFVKRRLVRRLIEPAQQAGASNRRTITLGTNLSIVDQFTGPTRLQRIKNPGQFRAIHMASSGYWQIGDDAS